MELPNSFNELTVRQFQEASRILKFEDDILERHIQLIACLTNQTIDWVESHTPAQIGEMVKKLDFLLKPDVNKKPSKFLALNKTVYSPILKMETINWGQVKTIKVLGEKAEYDNQYLNQQLACVYSKLNWYGKAVYSASDHAKKSQDLLDAKLGDVYGTLFFYSNVLEKLSPVIENSLKEATQTIAETMPEIMKWAKENPQILAEAGLKVS